MPEASEPLRDLLKKEARAYAYQVRGLWPGIKVPSVIAHQIEPGDLTGWSTDDLAILTQHAREQLQRQRADIEAIRQRAQFLFSTCLAALGLLGLAMPQTAATILGFGLSCLAASLILVSLLGGASVIVARKDLRMVDAAHLSTFDPPVGPLLARGLAMSIGDGENTVATLITVYRDAVLLLIIGMAVFAGTFLATF